MKFSVKDLPPEERPREKLAKYGAQNLSDGELLAILLRTGTRGYSVLDVARRLLGQHKNLAVISTKSISELCKVQGIGRDKAITLFAAFELARRLQMQSLFLSDQKITSPEMIAEYFIPLLRHRITETFIVVALNSANMIADYRQITEGILDASVVHPREVFKYAVEQNAKSLILVHNHPSGNAEPSREDIAITKKMVEAGKIFDIRVIDHLVVSGNSFTSLANRGLL